MKGISEWIWLIGGIIIAVIVFTIAMTQFQNAIRATIEKRSIEQYSQVMTTINDLCFSFEGNSRQYDIQIGETIEGIYASNDSHKKYSGNDLAQKTISGEKSVGNYLCLQIKGKRERCNLLDCNTTFPFVGTIPEKFSLSLLVNMLTGKGRVADFPLYFVREISGVKVDVSGVKEEITETTTTTGGTLI